MSNTRGDTPLPAAKQANYLIKMTLTSQFRLDFSSPLFFATAYSVVP